MSSTPFLAPLTGAKRLRELLSDPNYTLACPGVFDGLTARIALAAGFSALYMTGAGTSLSRLGFAGLGLVGKDVRIEQITMTAALSPSTPVIADADTGYGGPVQVARTVVAYARAGCAALHIEDQVEQKRCGHLLGKELVSREVYFAKLQAAVRARDQVQSEMMIFARTDARQGMGFDEAIARCEGAVEAGVDGIFFEAMQDKDEAMRVIACVREMEKKYGRSIPTLLNIVPGGTTPDFSIEEANEMGFRIVIFPKACIDPVIDAVGDRLAKLKETGKSGGGTGVKKEFNLCGLQECMEIDRLAGGSAYSTIGQ